MKTNAGEKHQRHAAVRPDVSAENQRLRTWLYKGEPHRVRHVVWIVELGEGRWLRCDSEGSILAYENPYTPAVSAYLWEVL